MYLLHWAVITVYVYVVRKEWMDLGAKRGGNGRLDARDYGVVVAATVALAYPVTRWVEPPVARWLQSRVEPAPPADDASAL